MPTTEMGREWRCGETASGKRRERRERAGTPGKRNADSADIADNANNGDGTGVPVRRDGDGRYGEKGEG
jgi:hypothetical protein